MFQNLKNPPDENTLIPLWTLWCCWHGSQFLVLSKRCSLMQSLHVYDYFCYRKWNLEGNFACLPSYRLQLWEPRPTFLKILHRSAVDIPNAAWIHQLPGGYWDAFSAVSFMNLHAVKTGWLLFSSRASSSRAAKHIAHKFSRETLLDNFRLFCHAALPPLWDRSHASMTSALREVGGLAQAS